MKKTVATSTVSRRQLIGTSPSSSAPTLTTITSFPGNCSRYKKATDLRPVTASAATGRQRTKKLTERPATAVDQRLVWSRDCSKRRTNTRSGSSLAALHTRKNVIVELLSPPGFDVHHPSSPVSCSDLLSYDDDDFGSSSSSSSGIGYACLRSPTASAFPVTLLKSRYVNPGGSLFSGMSPEARAAYDQMKQELLNGSCCSHSNDERSIEAANDRLLNTELRRNRASKSCELLHIDSNSTSGPPTSPVASLAVPDMQQTAPCISDESRQPSPSGNGYWTVDESAIPDVKISIFVQRPQRQSPSLKELPPCLTSRSRRSLSPFMVAETSTSCDQFRRQSEPLTITSGYNSRIVDSSSPTTTSGTEKRSSCDGKTESALRPKSGGRVNETESNSSQNGLTNHFRITSAGYDSRYAATGQSLAAKRQASAKSAVRTVVVVRRDRDFNNDVTHQQADPVPGGSDGGSVRSKSTETVEDQIELSIAKCRAWLGDGIQLAFSDRISLEPTA